MSTLAVLHLRDRGITSAAGPLCKVNSGIGLAMHQGSLNTIADAQYLFHTQRRDLVML